MYVSYKPEQLAEIDRQEECLLDKYREIIYSFKFPEKKYGVRFRVFLSWKNYISNIIYNDHRPIIQNGYMSFVCWQVCTPEGRVVESEDHDAYLDFAIQIGDYNNGVVKIDNCINDELYEYKEMIEAYFADPY